LTQTELDQVFEGLAATRDNLDARRDVLERAAHMLLHRSALGGQMIARFCETTEADPVLEDFSDLLGAALSAARMARESDQKRGDALLEAIESAVDLAAGQGRLESFHRLHLARSWAQNGLVAPIALELSEMADDVATHAHLPDAEMLEDLFRDLVTQADGDALTLHTALAEMFPAMPTALRDAVVEFAVARPDPIFAQLGCYWLVDPSATIRRAAARGLALRLEGADLSAEITSRLTVLRSWMPQDEARGQVDQILRDALRAGNGQASPDAGWKVKSTFASLPDGSGAQSIAIALASGKATALAMILLKTGYGVKDAYVIPCDSSRDQMALLDRMTEETGALSVPMEYVDNAVALALGDGLAHGLPPAPGLIDVAARCGLATLRPVPSDTAELLNGLSVHADVSALSAQKRGRLINASKDWWGLHELLRYWHDESDPAREALSAARGTRAADRALWTWLETRRDWWAHQIARCAELLDAIGDPDTESFVATAMALLDGRALKKIPIMATIHEQTIEAWVLDDPDLPVDAGLADFIALAEQQEPPPEGDGELSALLDGTDMTGDWIDGYLMSVVIAPKMITPNRWLPHILDSAAAGLDPADLQRFLDILMMRANAAIATVDGQIDFPADMKQRGVVGVREWASGFHTGRESFKSSWPKKSVGPTDQAILRQITEARTHGLLAPGIRIVGQWLSARHATNMKGT